MTKVQKEKAKELYRNGRIELDTLGQIISDVSLEEAVRREWLDQETANEIESAE